MRWYFDKSTLPAATAAVARVPSTSASVAVFKKVVHDIDHSSNAPSLAVDCETVVTPGGAGPPNGGPANQGFTMPAAT